MDDLKKAIHTLTNKLQVVLSFLETDQCDKALGACKDAIKDLRTVATSLSVLSKGQSKRDRDKALGDAVQEIVKNPTNDE